MIGNKVYNKVDNRDANKTERPHQKLKIFLRRHPYGLASDALLARRPSGNRNDLMYNLVKVKSWLYTLRAFLPKTDSHKQLTQLTMSILL